MEANLTPNRKSSQSSKTAKNPRKRKKGNDIPQGSVNFTINIQKTDGERIAEAARKSGMPKSAWARQVLMEALAEGVVFRKEIRRVTP